MNEPCRRCDLTAIVLTYNEEKHIKRCIESVRDIAVRIIVVDSYSTDHTCDIARAMGAEVFLNPFSTYAKQFNWALDNTGVDTEWVMRLDADEYLTSDLIGRMSGVLKNANEGTTGFSLNLRRIFMGKWLRFGALYPVRLLRIWRFGKGRCEERFMDEHVLVQGEVEHINADFADDNLNGLTWWTEKHNRYASREAVDLLNLEYGFIAHDTVATLSGGQQAGLKRWLKERVYARLPGGLRAFAYFFYRYVIRLGFLDGQVGTAFHVLQGFWYRYLVDAKVSEVKRYMADSGCDVVEAIRRVLEIEVLPAVYSGPGKQDHHLS